jgi:hypothetical protein
VISGLAVGPCCQRPTTGMESPPSCPRQAPAPLKGNSAARPLVACSASGGRLPSKRCKGHEQKCRARRGSPPPRTISTGDPGSCPRGCSFERRSGSRLAPTAVLGDHLSAHVCKRTCTSVKDDVYRVIAASRPPPDPRTRGALRGRTRSDWTLRHTPDRPRVPRHAFRAAPQLHRGSPRDAVWAESESAEDATFAPACRLAPADC